MDNFDFWGTIDSYSRVIIATHEIPDGDCIGSALALASALQQKGMVVQVANKEPIPPIYTFLAGSDQVLLPASLSTDHELAILVDCSDLQRLGFDLYAQCPHLTKVINIDHHISNTYFADVNIVDPNASATGEIIFNLITASSIKITPAIATALYTAIVTDTGSFQYENTKPYTLRSAASLMESGADLAGIRANIWENRPLTSIKVLSRALNNLATAADGQLAWIALSYAEITDLGADNEHMEGLVNYPRSIAGVEVGLFFKETEPDHIKVGFRSKQHVDVNLLAQQFNGGGHRRAAGCTIKAPMDRAINMVVSAAKDMLSKR